jgi:putative transposase
VTHAQRWHAHHKTAWTGPLYQKSLKSLPVQKDDHFLTVARYVERNALRAKFVERAEDWPRGAACSTDRKRRVTKRGSGIVS